MSERTMRRGNAFSYQFKNHRILSIEEERELFTKYKDCKCERGKLRIRNYVVLHNMKFVVECAFKYKNKYYNVSPTDLIGYGMLGLFIAMDKFDVGKNKKFITYAVFHIRQQINKNAQDNEGVVRIPSHKYIHAQKMVKHHIYTDEIMNILNTQAGGISLDKPITCDSKEKPIDFLRDDKNNPAVDRKHNFIKEKMKHLDTCLDNRTVKVLKSIYGLEGSSKQTMESVGKDLGISREAVRVIKIKALRTLSTIPHFQHMFRVINIPEYQPAI